MKKLLIVGLVAIVLLSGCITGEEEASGDITGNILADSPEVVVYTEGSCRRDTDCLLSHCRDDEVHYCMSTVQTLRNMRCEETGTLISEKDYVTCGCINNICNSAQ